MPLKPYKTISLDQADTLMKMQTGFTLVGDFQSKTYQLFFEGILFCLVVSDFDCKNPDCRCKIRKNKDEGLKQE